MLVMIALVMSFAVVSCNKSTEPVTEVPAQDTTTVQVDSVQTTDSLAVTQ